MGDQILGNTLAHELAALELKMKTQKYKKDNDRVNDKFQITVPKCTHEKSKHNVDGKHMLEQNLKSPGGTNRTCYAEVMSPGKALRAMETRDFPYTCSCSDPTCSNRSANADAKLVSGIASPTSEAS